MKDINIQLMTAHIGMDDIASEEETVTSWESGWHIQDKRSILFMMWLKGFKKVTLESLNTFWMIHRTDFHL
jgi:hypothetical protein